MLMKDFFFKLQTFRAYYTSLMWVHLDIPVLLPLIIGMEFSTMHTTATWSENVSVMYIHYYIYYSIYVHVWNLFWPCDSILFHSVNWSQNKNALKLSKFLKANAEQKAKYGYGIQTTNIHIYTLLVALLPQVRVRHFNWPYCKYSVYNTDPWTLPLIDFVDMWDNLSCIYKKSKLIRCYMFKALTTSTFYLDTSFLKV